MEQIVYWKRNRIAAIVIAVFVLMGMVIPDIQTVSALSAGDPYDYQPVVLEGEDKNSVKLLNIPDISVLYENDAEIMNEIPGSIDGMQNIRFTFVMSAGLNNFNETTFITHNMPVIKIYDSAGNVAAQYSGGQGALTYLGSGKSSEDNNQGGKKTTEIYIGVDKDILGTGEYVLEFGKSLCGNNLGKTLGKNVRFKFHVQATPQLQEMLAEAEEFLRAAPAGTEPGQYPQESLDVLQEAIRTAADRMDEIGADSVLSETEKAKEYEKAANALYQSLKECKAARIVQIKGIRISGIEAVQKVGDEGTAAAEVICLPDEEPYQKVRWQASSNIRIDEISGAWTAIHAGDGYVRAVSKTNPEQKKELAVNVQNDGDALSAVLIEAGDSAESVIRAALKDSDKTISDITALQLFTLEGGVFEKDDLDYIRKNLTSLRSLDLKHVSLEGNLIGNSWFAEWRSLQNLVLPEHLQVIDVRAFYNCSGLKTIEIPTEVTRIGNGAFAGCTAMNGTLTVYSANPPSVATVDPTGLYGDAFYGTAEDKNASVTTLRVPYGCKADFASANGWKRYKITEMAEVPLKVTFTESGTLPQAAAAACKAAGVEEAQVTTLTVTSPEGVCMDATFDKAYLISHFLGATKIDLRGTSFDRDNLQSEVFKDRKNPKEIKIPETVTHIGKRAFYGCSNLRIMTLPAALEAGSPDDPGIGEAAFAECGRLKTLVINAPQPPSYAGNMPTGITSIRVPNEYLDTYRNSDIYGTQYKDMISAQSAVKCSAAAAVEILRPTKLAASIDSIVDIGNSMQWRAADPTMADISDDGILTGKRYGTVKVIITAGFGTANECRAECMVTIKKPAALSLSASSNSYNSNRLTWSAMAGAEGYQIFRVTKSGGSKSVLATVKGSTRSYIDTGRSTGTMYYYQVRGYRTVDGTRIYTEDSSVKGAKPLLSKTTGIKAARGGSKKIKVTWKRVSGASGYTVYRSTKKTKGFKAVKTCKSGKTVKYVSGKLKKGKRYYFKVRAYRTVKKKKLYGSYSSVVSYKVK